MKLYFFVREKKEEEPEEQLVFKTKLGNVLYLNQDKLIEWLSLTIRLCASCMNDLLDPELGHLGFAVVGFIEHRIIM